jgi:hypothetical protein
MELNSSQQEIVEAARLRRRAQNLLSIQELSQFLELSVRSIRRLHAAGMGPPRIRRSRRLMYPVPRLLEWLPTFGGLKMLSQDRAECPPRNPSEQAVNQI